MNTLSRLKELYAKNSKHSNYQILSSKLASILGEDKINVKSRYERERLDYILSNISVSGKNILDIGGNSGFFTFESIEQGAKTVHYYEGNKAHSDFVKSAAEVLGCAERIEIANTYYTFELENTRKYDVVFLLNVLHHLGDDYGDNTLSIDTAKKQMLNQLNIMATNTNHLVFQIGFCWKGNRNIGLFKNGTKREMIDFISTSIPDVWEVTNIGIPVKAGVNVSYVNLDDQNILRNDSLGEFLNRPLFILRAK